MPRGRRRRGALIGVGRLQEADNPRRAVGSKAIGDLSPCIGTRNRVGAGQPILLPIMLAPGLLVGREVGLVAV